MNVLVILIVALVLFLLGYRLYARFIERVFDVDGTHPTPAAEIHDGVDYVPTKKFVLFGHHFASIAGGGPIIGPTVALVFGYVPVWLWIVLGTLLIGGVHDFSALLASVRERGRSVAEIAERNGPLNNVVFLQRYKGEGDKWVGEMETSLTATKNAIEVVSSRFSATGEKSIVLVSSIADEHVAEGQPAGYHVAKAGLHHMARYYAVALGPKGIRVNCVSPCTFIKQENASFYARSPALVELFKRTIPLGRMGTAADSANVIAFLCSPEAAFVTGQRITVDGGVSLLSQESLARKIAGV